MTTRPVELAPEPAYDDVEWVSAYDIDPLSVPLGDKVELLVGRSARLLQAAGVEHSSAGVRQVVENKFYTDLAGTTTTQQRVRVDPDLEVHGTNQSTGVFDSMRSIAPPVGRGWEYLTDGYDWDATVAELPDLLAGKLAAPSVEAGRYDLVIHPSNLWLTIHESVGHATELDRALGYEANYAGTSFATVDQLGRLQYGSPGHARHRRPHRGARPVHRRVRRRGRAHRRVGHRQGRRARRLPARPLDGRDDARAQRRPLQRLRVRRLSRPHPHPADGQRLAAAGDRRSEHRGAHRPGGARHLRRRRQVVVDRHAALQLPVHRPAVLPDRERSARRASCATSPTRPPPPTSGTAWPRSADPTPGSSAAR